MEAMDRYLQGESVKRESGERAWLSVACGKLRESVSSELSPSREGGPMPVPKRKKGVGRRCSTARLYLISSAHCPQHHQSPRQGSTRFDMTMGVYWGVGYGVGVVLCSKIHYK
jgi:hypothetical protein